MPDCHGRVTISRMFRPAASQSPLRWGWLSFSGLVSLVAPAASTAVANDTDRGSLGNNGSQECTPRSVETFPPDLFTLEQKQNGAIVLHVFGIVWLFVGLAIVCENYLVPSLEVVCESLHLKPDVAGATFMAAGNSALELLASVIGVFLAKSDVGVSTIVGSGIFNNLMISSLCGLAATQAICLSYWPMFRDCGFYCVSLAALVAIIHDERVTWFESTILLGIFAAYILVMVFNNRIDSAIRARWPSLATKSGATSESQSAVSGPASLSSYRMEVWATDNSETEPAPTEDDQAALVMPALDGRPESPFLPPLGFARRARWLLALPWAAVFWATVPDCRRPGLWRRLFLLTFLVSVLWISGLIYLLVWTVCVTGDALGVPDTVMGLTLLSVGTCLPDAMSGVFVSRKGIGEMAVANSIASNVFDITACLGLPWLLSCLALKPGSSVTINSAGLTYTSIALLSTVVFLFSAVCLNRLRLDRKLGFIFMLVYLLVVTFACLYESNVFGPLNPPPCPRTRL